MSHLVTVAKERSKKTGIACDLDVAWIQSLYERQNGLCFWYQIEMQALDEYRNPLQPSLDRLDCSRGHTKDNVVLTCAAANMGRSDATPEAFWHFAQKLAENFRRPLKAPSIAQ